MEINLFVILSDWLKEEFPNQFIIKKGMDCVGYIYYKPLMYFCVEVFEDRIVIHDIDFGRRYKGEDLIIRVCDEKLLPLLYNKLYMMSLGFKKAIRGRDQRKK